MSTESQQQNAPKAGLGLGTFLGVYTPTVLTILGVILYLRMGWVVGNAGVMGAIAIVVIAHAITITTALSMSALSSNMRVGVGGAYYIISRSMGLELGGAIGIPLYLSQALSVTLYAFGLSEAFFFAFNIQVEPWVVQATAAGIIVAVTGLAARSTVLALKAQLPIMIFIAISLVALWAGVAPNGLASQVPAWGPEEQVDFFGVFAVFFPAVTGVLAGVGLSGDLKDPGISIPRGVLAAVATGFIVYITVPIVIGAAGDVETLQTDSLIWTKVAFAGSIAILPGLFGAVFSSAIGSILGAPRTLQALAQDGLMPKRLGQLDEKNGEPMLALYLSGAVALGAVLLGDLNAVAEVVSMFFLTVYGTLNLAAGAEAWIRDPSYRPRIRVPWWVSILGALGCFLVMGLINPAAFVIAMVIEFGLWWLIAQRSMKATWGDLRSGLWMSLARFAMIKLRTARVEARNWRPHLLVFSADVQADVGVVNMAAHFGQDHGLVSVSTLVLGDLDEREHADRLLVRNKEILEKAGVMAFPEVHVVQNLEQALLTAAQANGIAGLDSNTVVFRWPRKTERLPRLVRWVRHLDGLHKSTLIMRPIPGSRTQGRGEVLVWWAGKESNGDLMLLLAHLLNMSKAWRRARITLVSVVNDAAEAAGLNERVSSSLTGSNIATSLECIQRVEGQSTIELIQERSAHADLVFLGMPLAEPGQEEAVAERLLTLVDGMPSVILVRNSGPFRGRLV